MDSVGTRLVVLDNSLVSMSGHSRSYDEAIKLACEQLGFGFLLFGTNVCEIGLLESIGGERIFRYANSLEIPASSSDRRQLNFLVQNTQFFIDLCKISQRIDQSDVIFLPTTTYNNLYGLYWWLTTLGSKRPRLVNVFLRWNEVGNPFMQAALQVLHKLSYVRFLTDTETLMERYRSIGVSKIKKVPIPHATPTQQSLSLDSSRHVVDRLDAFRDVGTKSGELVIGFVGEARIDKGFHLIPSIINSVLGMKSSVKFLVKTTTKVGGNQTRRDLIDAAAVALRELEQKGALLLIDEPLSTSDYWTVMSGIDIVCVPYLREYYINNSSGVMAEAIAGGKPVIVTRGTWLELEALRFGCGVTVADESVEGFAFAILSSVSGYKELKSRSEHAAARFLAYHNPEYVVREIFSPV